MAHPELQAEQAHLDHAYGCLERMRSRIARALDAGSNEFSAAALEAWQARTLASYEDAERGICFGRLDMDEGDPLYVGRRWIHDDDQELVIVNWQAPAARPFYTATPITPQHVERRRRFRTEGRTLLDIADETFGETAGDEPRSLGDFLLEELERSRDRHMREIVATIQADQYRLITHEPEGTLVVQGGPGTGKTAVGLHRASWLLFTHAQRLRREGILVVGPNRTFIEYVSHVLPSLGESSVVQRAVGDLREGTAPAGRDEPEVELRKGDAAMAETLRDAVAAHRRDPEEELEAMLGRNYVRVSLARVRELAGEVWDDAPSWDAARERLRMGLLRAFYQAYSTKLGSDAMRSFEDLERALTKGGYLKRFVDRILPPLVPERVLLEALGLTRKPAQWTEGDIALLDELDELIHGRPKTFGHVVVDEAQDLTPMQLRMVARRAATGWMTLLGDVAQATGPVAYERWDEVLEHLPGEEATVEELVLAYRVPAEIMRVALPLLPQIAPHVRPPEAYREGGEPPRIVRDDQVAQRVAEEAVVLDAGEGSVAVVAPLALVSELRELLTRAEVDVDGSPVEDLAPAVRVLGARDAKGLEFDHVVLAEPAAVVAEAEGVQGRRHLYVALTRATKTLTVVHAQPLPW
ncbi:MAG TPA: UvrD-helicase domain-containing protein [Gaiellaceae bacterium]|nr:UvrD-helicase domain-containing protein [Gaiellaceae bacterium]